MPRWIPSSHEAGSHWNAEAARGDDTGRRFWALVTTLPLTLLTLVSVFAAWRALGAVRGWWLAATFAALGDRALTFAYFIPAMVGLMRASGFPIPYKVLRVVDDAELFLEMTLAGGWKHGELRAAVERTRASIGTRAADTAAGG